MEQNNLENADNINLDLVAQSLEEMIDVLVFTTDNEIETSLKASAEKNKIRMEIITNIEEFELKSTSSFPRIGIIDSNNKKEIDNFIKNTPEAKLIIISDEVQKDFFEYISKENIIQYFTKPLDITLINGMIKKTLELPILPEEENRLKYKIKHGNTTAYLRTKMELISISIYDIGFISPLNFTKGSTIAIQNSNINEFMKIPIIRVTIKESKPDKSMYKIKGSFIDTDDSFLNSIRNYINTESCRIDELKQSKKK